MKYSNEFKRVVINEYNKGTTYSQIKEKYNIKKQTLYLWLKTNNIKLHREEKNSELSFRLNSELIKNKKLELDNNFYKDLLKILDLNLEQKIKFGMQLFDIGYTKVKISKLLKIERATLIRNIDNRNKMTRYEKERIELTKVIIEEFYNSDRRLSPEKMSYILKEKGFVVSEKRVSKIMKENNLVSRRLKKPIESNCNKITKRSFPKFNILKQDFNKLNPNEAWCGDVTEVKVNGIKVYISSIIECFSRMVIGWSISTCNDSKLTTLSLKRAFEFRNHPKGTIFHSDQGTNYTSREFLNLLTVLELKESKSKKGTPYDNAIVESFFSNLKQDDLNSRTLNSIRELDEVVNNYVEYYNNIRPHETLNFKSPKQFENEYYKKNIQKSDVFTSLIFKTE